MRRERAAGPKMKVARQQQREGLLYRDRIFDMDRKNDFKMKKSDVTKGFNKAPEGCRAVFINASKIRMDGIFGRHSA